jgi:predicted nucleic acid-binding protein
MLTWLIDTGPLVSFFDRRNAAHKSVRECVNGFRGRLCTTGAVICEAMHFLPDVAGGPEKLSEFVLSSGLDVFEATQPTQIRAAVNLINRYQDTPMDFADATLVLLAQEVRSADILTLDRRGFRTYCTQEGKGFKLVLG